MDIEEHPPRWRAIAQLIAFILVFAISSAVVACHLVGGSSVYISIGAGLSAGLGSLLTVTMLFFIIRLNNATNMEDSSSGIQDHIVKTYMKDPKRLTHHTSPLTLAYNSITDSNGSPPATFSREKFESGLVGWSDYKHFVKNSALESSVPQPVHTFIAPEYIAINEDQATGMELDSDWQKHPRRYDRLPDLPNPWSWRGNVAQIKRESFY